MSSPKVWVPLLILGAIHLTIVYLLFLFPRPPVQLVLGPIIKRFFGQTYLHYPFNFVILPYLVKICRQFLAVFLDFYFLAAFAVLGLSFWRRNTLELRTAFSEPLRKLLPLLTYSILIIVLVFALRRVPPYVFNYIYSKNMVTQEQLDFSNMINLILRYTMEFFATLLKTFFVFTIPYLVLEGRGLLASIDRSFQLALKNFFTTFFLLLVPTALIFGLEQFIKTPQSLIESHYPEMVFQILLATEALNVLFCFLLMFPIVGIYSKNEGTGGA